MLVRIEDISEEVDTKSEEELIDINKLDSAELDESELLSGVKGPIDDMELVIRT